MSLPRPGDRVVLCGLFRPEDTHLNGAPGVVVMFADNRCFVLLDPPTTTTTPPGGLKAKVVAAHPFNVAPKRLQRRLPLFWLPLDTDTLAVGAAGLAVAAATVLAAVAVGVAWPFNHV